MIPTSTQANGLHSACPSAERVPFAALGIEEAVVVALVLEK
jgi:hypothetical protein